MIYMIENEQKIIPKCPRCESIEGQMYSSFSKYPKAFKDEAIRLYQTGLSAREVGKILNVNKGSVLNWIRKLQNDSTKI